MDGQGDGIYVAGDRDAVPPECLLKSACSRLYRSERKALPEQCTRTCFSVSNTARCPKNRARLMQHDVAKLLFGQAVAQAQQARLMSPEHFSVNSNLDA